MISACTFICCRPDQANQTITGVQHELLLWHWRLDLWFSLAANAYAGAKNDMHACMHGFGQKLHNCITALHLYVLPVDLPDRLGV